MTIIHIMSYINLTDSVINTYDSQCHNNLMTVFMTQNDDIDL